MHRGCIEAYNRIISIYSSNDYQIPEELQEEVDELLKIARNSAEDPNVPENNQKEDPHNGNDDAELDTDDDDAELGTEEARRFRAITARLNYLA